MPDPEDLPYKIGVLSLNAGDVVVIKCHDIISDSTATRLKALAQAALPDDVKVLVLDAQIDIGAIEFLRFKKQ